METTTFITVYIKNEPYNFQVHIDHERGMTTYYVSSENKNPPAYIPDDLQFNMDGELTQEIRLKTVEQEQIARLIWQEILNKLNP